MVLEGADGCGKSTQARALVETLRGRGLEGVHVRDPGSTRLAERVREVLLDPATGDVAVAAETFLYFAARAQLVREVVEPALERGAWVVCERWTLSTEVYQGDAGGYGVERVRALEPLAVGRTLPDHVLVLDVPVGEGLARIGRSLDRMESKGAQFHARVVAAYRDLAAGRDRHVVIPTGSVDEVARRVREEVFRAG